MQYDIVSIKNIKIIGLKVINFSQKRNSHRAVNTLRLGYTNQSVNAV